MPALGTPTYNLRLLAGPREYLWISDRPIPPLSFGRHSLFKLIFGVLCRHKNLKNIVLIEVKKDVGSELGIVCSKYNMRGSIGIFITEALPNQEGPGLSYVARSLCICLSRGKQLLTYKLCKDMGNCMSRYIMEEDCQVNGKSSLQCSTSDGDGYVYHV